MRICLEQDVESGISDEQIRELVAGVFDFPIKSHVTAEINPARFIRRITLDLQERAEALSVQLEEYQKTIE